MSEEVEIDQEVYDKLIAEGKSERIARAKAKAASVRAKKAAAGEQLGPREASAPKPAAAKAEAKAGAGPAAGGGGGVATAQRSGALTPEERQARVAAALESKSSAKAQPRKASALAGQDHTHRLLAMVPPSGIQQIRGKQEDKVYTWPHLISAEFVCILAVTAGLMVFSALVSAPLGELANANVTPNPSKAPWYFMGLQEMLRYFHPMVAGVTLPTIFIIGFIALPYLDKNPSVKPENRKTAYMVYTFYMVFWGVLTIIGSFFRGPGFNWVWPWVDGLWFVLYALLPLAAQRIRGDDVMTIALLLLGTAAGLLALAFWWIRRANPAAAVTTRATPTAPACDIGQQLLMASAAGGDSGGGAKTAKPKRSKPSGPSRRAFLRNSMAVAWLGVLGGFGGATLAFLWPSLRGGFGAQLEVDSEDAIVSYIRENREPYPFPAGRAYFVEYDESNDPDGVYAEITNGASVMAIYQVCVHLGCKVPWCQSSQWFECPCHGSRYNRWAEFQGGPAPRGLDRFALTVEDGTVVLDTSVIIEGPSRQGNVLEQPPEGPSCLGG